MANGTHYLKYPQTIKTYASKDENTMKASGNWADRDETVKQQILPYDEQGRIENIGYVLEKMVVIDLDNHEGGINGIKMFNEWIRMQSQEKQNQIYEDVMSTLQVATPGGGIHIHFTINENIASLNLTSVTNYMGGIDIIIGRNQFTPAPKNFRRDGEYKILDNSSEYIQEAPDWVVEWLLDTKKQKKEKEMTQDVGASQTKDYEVNTTYNTIITEMFEGFGQGERHSRLVEHAGRIIALIRYKKLTIDNGIKILFETSKNCHPPYDEKETARIWRDLMKRE
ncbi:bifunctional DNA primase/polymerase [Staphylococcus warneri]|uniref:bifunctional DNA primase/polymerase n=1 Tax=Staphylococcus warneri TaxID=1292 RepID=UPI001899713F|nr:bifunctional DNA primase/polymerase [Staphylococcus warneri]